MWLVGEFEFSLTHALSTGVAYAAFILVFLVPRATGETMHQAMEFLDFEDIYHANCVH